MIEPLPDEAHRTPTGGFLRAVLANDLTEAVCRADEQSLAALRDIVQYVYNCMPHSCHGSYQRVELWLAARKSDIVEVIGAELEFPEA